MSGLVELLRSPQQAGSISDADWNDIIEAGRKTQLLGQLAASLRRHHVFDSVPLAVQRHLQLAELTSEQRSKAAMWEIQMFKGIAQAGVPLVLLKGCAYALAGDVHAQGRLFADIDLLVDRVHLQAAENHLIALGWRPEKVNAYDQRYYREWSHEVPPMEHVRRHTVIDLHHAINPPVSRLHVPMSRLMAQRVEMGDGLYVLSPLDRTVHCALHLLQEGESTKLARDLYDLNSMVEQHCPDTAGMVRLFERASELGVRPLVESAVHAAQYLYDRHVECRWESGPWLARCLVIASDGLSGNPKWRQNMAAWLLLAYSHYLKMPLRILVPHLTRKALIGKKPAHSTQG
jgi:hypothetical protein